MIKHNMKSTLAALVAIIGVGAIGCTKSQENKDAEGGASGSSAPVISAVAGNWVIHSVSTDNVNEPNDFAVTNRVRTLNTGAVLDSDYRNLNFVFENDGTAFGRKSVKADRMTFQRGTRVESSVNYVQAGSQITLSFPEKMEDGKVVKDSGDDVSAKMTVKLSSEADFMTIDSIQVTTDSVIFNVSNSDETSALTFKRPETTIAEIEAQIVQLEQLNATYEQEGEKLNERLEDAKHVQQRAEASKNSDDIKSAEGAIKGIQAEKATHEKNDVSEELASARETLKTMKTLHRDLVDDSNDREAARKAETERKAKEAAEAAEKAAKKAADEAAAAAAKSADEAKK